MHNIKNWFVYLLTPCVCRYVKTYIFVRLYSMYVHIIQYIYNKLFASIVANLLIQVSMHSAYGRKNSITCAMFLYSVQLLCTETQQYIVTFHVSHSCHTQRLVFSFLEQFP